MPYQFPGIVRFLDAACDSVGLTAPDGSDAVTLNAVNDQRHRARSGWHLKTIIDALTQLPDMAEKAKAGHIDPTSAQSSLDRINLVVKGLEAQLTAAKAAIADVVAGLDVKPSGTDAPDGAFSDIKQPKKKGDAKP